MQPTPTMPAELRTRGAIAPDPETSRNVDRYLRIARWAERRYGRGVTVPALLHPQRRVEQAAWDRYMAA